MKKYINTVIVFLLLTSILTLTSCKDKSIAIEGGTENREAFELLKEDNSNESELREVSESAEPETVCVHVCGAVNKEGLYYLDSESRIADAVTAAGDFKKNAAKDYLNLAEKVTDGKKIYVPTKKEVEEGGGSPAEKKGKADRKIDINKADKAALMTLKGIGESRAEEIINYREKNGKFKKIEDIMNVSGIKDASFEKIKDKIKVE